MRLGNFIKFHKWSSLLVVVGFLVGGYILWDSFSAGVSNLPDIKIVKKPKIEKVRAPLSGILVEPEIAKKTPVAIVVENHPDARPQSGLNKADMVFETFAEGGITRFLAIYQTDESAREIGPVRSARPYFVEWAKSYAALFAHVGGSIDALDLIKNLNVYDLNQFNFGKYFWRDQKRFAPHNVYTTIANLRSAARTKNYPAENTKLASYNFKEDTPQEGRGPAAAFKVNFNGSFYVTYAYVPADNYYYRSVRGVKQTDRPTGEQIRAKNVVVCFSDFSYGKTRYNEQKVNIRTTGSGKAIIYRDGTVISGTWKRSAGNIVRFYDQEGKEAALNAGTTWVDFVPNGTAVK